MNPTVNNWSYGEISQKLGGRLDIAIYSQGCKTLNNFYPRLQGGISRRPPLVHIADSAESRIIPFIINRGLSFLLQFSNGKLQIWNRTASTFELLTLGALGEDYLASPYYGTELWDLQFAQYYEKIYFAHSSHKQKVLVYNSGAFTFSDFTITTDEGNNFGQSVGNYPGVVSVRQNRLWYARTNNQPYTIWASRPYEDSSSHSDFTTKDTVTTSTEVLKDPSLWPPYAKDAEGNNLLNGDGLPYHDSEQQYDLSNSALLLTTETVTENVITASCAMQLELSSGRNDRISWIAGMTNIVVGTESSVWMMPYNIDPTQQSASFQLSYGCNGIQPDYMHNSIIFLQNGEHLRQCANGQYGLTSDDLSFSGDHMLRPGVRQMACMTNPDSYVFNVLDDGNLGVYSYDPQVGIKGWSRWITEGSFISVAILETVTGQELYAVVERNGAFYIERFDFAEEEHFIDRKDAINDGNLQYISYHESNRFDFIGDSGSSIGRNKAVKDIWLRCLNTGHFYAGTNSGSLQRTLSVPGSDDIRIASMNGSEKEVTVILQSFEDNPMNILAMSYQVEVR